LPVMHTQQFGSFGQDPMRPGDHTLALRGEPLEPLPAQHDHDIQFVLQLAYGNRERRLTHMACRRGAAEVALARECHQVLQLLDRHLTVHRPLGRSVIVITYHTMSDCEDRGLVRRDRPLLPSSRRHHQTVGLTSAENGYWLLTTYFATQESNTSDEAEDCPSVRLTVQPQER